MIQSRLLVVSLLASGVALAQPAPPPAPDAPPDPGAPAEPPAPPAPSPPPAPPPPPAITPAAETAAPAPALVRPEGLSIGIGIGYRFPTALSLPNAASVRVRLPSAITIEPTLVLASSTQTIDVGTPEDTTSSQLGVGALARFPVIKRKRTDLELLGGVQVDRLSQDPSDLNLEDQTLTTSVGVSYGLAVGLWITQNLQLSLTATNALVTYSHTRQEMGGGFVQVTNSTTFGLIFDPSVTMMVHLYN